MIAEVGHFALILALVVAVVQATVPMIGAARGRMDWMGVAEPAASLQFVLIMGSFAALTHAFVTSDFSVQLVAANSHSLKPMLYKVTGTWGNHEGSMLLWVLILALFGALVAWRGGNLPPRLRARVLSVQAMIGVAFLAFLIFTSNPFVRLDPAPVDGRDLNPLLQDPGLAFHPPFLYLGYVGLSMAFSFAIAALIEGRVDAAWARWVRPWTLAAWVFLTIGIALGSYWAYYELGWGGWWFWDPVENASFMPWLVAAALLHSAIVVEKRESLKSWTVLLAILAFSFSLVGTFLVRSGVITSVHAFANDPERGVFILLILAVAIGGALTLYAFRASALVARGVFGTVSRESALILNNLLLFVSALVVLIGTLWPLVAEFTTGDKVSVGPPFFDLVFTPFMVVLAIALPVGAMLPWKRGSLARSLKPLRAAFILAFCLFVLVWSLQTGGRMLAPIGLALAAWLVLGAFTDLARRARAGDVPAGETLRRLWKLPGADWGKAVAHAGVGATVFGVAAITAWEIEDLRVMKPGETMELGNYSLRLDEVAKVQGPNFVADEGRFTLIEDNIVLRTMTSQKRFYPVQRMPTTEAGIDMGWTRDVYVTLGDPQADGGWAVRAYLKPFANWIWLGSLIMAFGGMLSLFDRRYRVGAPADRRVATQGVPAE